MDTDRLIDVALFVVPIVLVSAAIVAARRFARQREREGLWNANGPIHPTPPPGDWGIPPGYGGHRPQIESEPDDSSLDPPDDAA
jgi:hypothetical protein